MTDHQPQWGCPYCSQVFPSKDHLKGHLELDKQIIFHLLSQLQQALLPNCHQFREANDGSIASDRENDVNVNSTKRSHAKKPLRCPSPDCRQTKQTYSKKTHLLRHFKMHVVCNAACACGQKFDRVDQFEKHLQNDCSIMQDKARDIPGLEQKHMQILGLKNVLISSAKQNLNQQLERIQKHGPSDDAMESSTSYETLSTKLPDGKRKRTREREGIPASLLTTTKARLSTNSDQEGFMMEGVISPKPPFDSAVQRGPLDGVGSISSYIGAITGVQTDPHIAVNSLGATQAFGNSISRLHPNQSTDTSTQNAHGVNPPTPGSDIIGTVVMENQSQYRTGLEWSDFNACGRGISQDQWDSLTSMRSLERYHWDGANTHGDIEKWSCVSNDWNSFHAPFNGFNNVLARNI